MKILKKQDGTTLEIVQEVLEVTGFTSILTIECAAD